MKGHRRHHDDILDNIHPRNYPIDNVRKHLSWMENDVVTNPDITLYTDGSKEEHVGAGWAACHGDTVMAEESVYLGLEASVFQAEVIAIDRGLRWVNENCNEGLGIKFELIAKQLLNPC